jgi:Na+/pantothenate symporter
MPDPVPTTLPSLLAAGSANAALATFTIYTIAVFGLAWAANRLLRSKSFLSEYYLGSRSLGMWAFALTFAATSSSGGSFTGFPSKIYTYGWVLALWIASYMVVPICAMGLLGKRINQIARKVGAITIPDLLRDRFQSRAFALVATVLIVYFMSANLVAQFKAGSLILNTLLADVPLFHDVVEHAAGLTDAINRLGGLEADRAARPDYVVCLFVFAAAVIAYTAYGGFHAVVWTDVLQGVVMISGVLILLPLSIYLAGGLSAATRDMAQMKTPVYAKARIERMGPADRSLTIPRGRWFTIDARTPGNPEGIEYARLGAAPAIFAPGERAAEVELLILDDPSPKQRERIVREIEATGPLAENVSVETSERTEYRTGARTPGVYVTGPGPSAPKDTTDGFLPLSLAISFFFMWSISSTGQPSYMVRLMAFDNSRTLRRAIFTVSIYYTLIYFPLVVIFCIARVLLPGMEQEADRIMPAMAVYVTENVGMGWLAGLLVAAPFAAIMSTVDSFLLMISSALVRDVYQRNVNPAATERRLRVLGFAVTALVGIAALLGAVNPPQYLQDLVVYCGSGLAACFLFPVALALYWPRMNSAGAIAGMLGGFFVHLGVYVAGYLRYGRFEDLAPLGIGSIVWGLLGSLAMTVLITLATPPPPREIVRRFFSR